MQIVRYRTVHEPPARTMVWLFGFNGTPTAFGDEDVGGPRRALAQGVRAEPHLFLTFGGPVQFTAGPLAGCEGMLVRRKGNLRVVLSIDLIERSILMDIDAFSLELANRRWVGITPVQTR